MATAKSSSKTKPASEAKHVTLAQEAPAPVSKKKAAPVKASKTAEVQAGAAKPVGAKKAKAAPAAKKAVAQKAPSVPAPAAAPTKPVKDKLVRDSFTMPRSDFALIDQLKEKALGFKRPTKKSELLRAGLHVLAGLSDAKLKAALGALVPLKVGRPPRGGQ